MFPGFLAWCDDHRAVVVLAAGNFPEKRLHELVPQKFGTADNGIITVGGVEKDGTFWRDTTQLEAGQAGSMSVFAPARDVIVPGPPIGDTGTSQAAAIVVSRHPPTPRSSSEQIVVRTSSVLLLPTEPRVAAYARHPATCGQHQAFHCRACLDENLSATAWSGYGIERRIQSRAW